MSRILQRFFTVSLCLVVAQSRVALAQTASASPTATPKVTPAATSSTRSSDTAAPKTSTSAAPTATPSSSPTATPTPALPQRGTYTISGSGEALSIFAVGVDAPELLTALADRAGLSLLVDDTVSRKITVNIIDKSARQIVQEIARAYGLSASDVGGITMISEGIPRSPASYLLSEIDSIPTRYVDANNARNLLPVFLQDYVKVNSEQNAVVLSAPREVLNKFRQDIAQFDIPAAQIMLDLLLVELTDTTTDQLGLSLTFNNNGNGLNLIPGLGSASFRALTTLNDGFFADLRALEEKSKARVRANPRVATVSGRRASIFVGRQRYVLTPIEGGRNFIDAGVRLNVTPYTGGEKQVLIEVDAEVSTLSALDPTTRLPEKSTRTANTTVRINDGQTLVIGGLKQQELRDIRTKVPILGSLPLIGNLFRTKDVRSTETELVLFITPRILSDTGHLPAEEERAQQQQFLGPDLNRPLPAAPESAFTIPPGTFAPLPLDAPTSIAPDASTLPR